MSAYATITVHYPGKSEPLTDRDGRLCRVWSTPRVFLVRPAHVPDVLRSEYRWMRRNDGCGAILGGSHPPVAATPSTPRKDTTAP